MGCFSIPRLYMLMFCFEGFPTLYSFEPTLNSSPLIDIFGFFNQTYWVMLILLHYIFAIATIRLELSIDLTILLKKSWYLLSIVFARTTGVFCNILRLQYFGAASTYLNTIAL